MAKAKKAEMKEEMCEGCGNAMAACSCDAAGCCGSCGGCNCIHHKMPAFLITLAGLVFLAGATGWMSAAAVSLVWPVLLTLYGVLMLLEGKCNCC